MGVTAAAKTSCHSVVDIGDSTSEGLDSAEDLPNPKERIPNRYAEVGVKETHMEVQGARSIEERFEDLLNMDVFLHKYSTVPI